MLYEELASMSSAISKSSNPDADEIERKNKIREIILDNIDSTIYVSDLETNKILFVNKKLQQSVDRPLIDRCCWEALHCRDKRCNFCPIYFLLKNPGKNYKGEFYNPSLEKSFLIQAGIIPWFYGKLTHLSCAVDISELNH